MAPRAPAFNGRNAIDHAFRRVTRQEFDFVKQIAKGAFGRVDLMIRKRDGEQFALKTIRVNKDQMDYKQKELLANEALICLGTIADHPNIVHFVDVFFEATRVGGVHKICFVMPYYKNGSLKQQIDEHARKNIYVDEKTVWFYISELTTALAHLHRHDIIHRDVKPDNVMIADDGGLILADLGLVRVKDPIPARSIVGTPLFMAKEILNSDAYDEKADMWSLGILLGYVCLLRHPFNELATLQGLIYSVNNDDPLPLPAQYSGALIQLYHALLRKRASQRPSAVEVQRRWHKQSPDNSQNVHNTQERVMGVFCKILAQLGRPKLVIALVLVGALGWYSPGGASGAFIAIACFALWHALYGQ